MKRPTTRAGLTATVLIVVGAVLVGCSAITLTPTPDPGKVLHVENRVASGVVFDVNARGGDGTGVSVKIGPCGGRFEARPGVAGVPTTELLMGITTDPLADPAQALAANPTGVSSESWIVWSTGELTPTDLPKWITIQPDGVVVTDHPNASPVPSPCSWWTRLPETPKP